MFQKALSVVFLSLVSSLCGCSSFGEYMEARALDLWDIVPVSVSGGPGLWVSARATHLVQNGFGFGRAVAYGMGPGRWGPRWEQEELGMLFFQNEQWHLDRRLAPKEEMKRWPGGPDDRALHCRFGRGARMWGSTLFVLPMPFDPDGAPIVPAPWHAWASVDAQVHAILGLRVGFCPDEVVDFLAGLAGFDLFGDDPGGKNDQSWGVPPPPTAKEGAEASGAPPSREAAEEDS